MTQFMNLFAVGFSISIGTAVTMILEENGAEWIHTAWVVVATCLIMDFSITFDGKISRMVKNIVPMILGLAIGIVTGLVVRAMGYWACPRWSILLVRVFFITGVLIGAVLVIQLKIGSQIFRGRWSIEPSHMIILCVSSSLPLFSSSTTLAISRCVGFLFASAISIAVTGFFLAIEIQLSKKEGIRGTIGKRILSSNPELIRNTLSLVSKSIKGLETDKECVDFLHGEIRKNLDLFESSTAPVPFFGGGKSTTIGWGFSGGNTSINKSTSSRKTVELLSSQVRTLSYECNSIYWSMMSVSLTPFLCRDGHSIETSSTSTEIAFFTNDFDSFNRYFGPSMKKIEVGISELRDALILLVSMPDAGTSEAMDDARHRLVDRITSELVGYNLVEGFQGLEFNFSQVGRVSGIFSSNGQRWNMCSYLVNLAAVIVSTIDFVRVVVSQLGLPSDIQSHTIGSLSRDCDKINSIQKIGSFNDLLSLGVALDGTSAVSIPDGLSSSMLIGGQ